MITVFVGGDGTQGEDGVGRIVDFMVDYQDLIQGGAASPEDDIYNQILYIK